jgi:hypothetical protein
MERGSPRGIMFGNYDVSKWRNLSKRDRADLHGVMTTATGSMREGPVTVRIFESASPEAKRSFHQTALAIAE